MMQNYITQVTLDYRREPHEDKRAEIEKEELREAVNRLFDDPEEDDLK